jgi:UV DNA damage endonuclease
MVAQLAALPSEIADRSITILNLLATLLDAMGLDHDAVIVVHVGGLRGAPDEAIGRWIARWERLPVHVQRRVVLEHEDDGASLGVALRVHAVTGVPVVFDHLHWCLNNPEDWSAPAALAAALATWGHDRTPKIHFSSPRTELQAVERVDAHGKRRWGLRPPRAGHHADFLNPWEFGALARSAAHLRDFDVMLEAKASDMALLRLRHDLERYVPDVGAWIDGGGGCKQL